MFKIPRMNCSGSVFICASEPGLALVVSAWVQRCKMGVKEDQLNYFKN